jgi:SulP family sulfate permease
MRPQLFSSLRNYSRQTFLSDLGAGITVGVVALPLAIGFAIASGVTPGQGLWTAIIAGLLISVFGGSKVQIGGPTGAFVPILGGIVATYGYEGLAIATILAGLMLLAMGFFRLGNLIKFIPYPVIAGFTSGIAVIIFTGQIKEFLGLSVAFPRHTTEQFVTIATHLGETQWPVLGLGALTVAILLLWPRQWAAVPPSIIAVLVTTAIVAFAHPAVETIGSKFGAEGIPSGLPALHLPHFDFDHIRDLMLPAFTIAMLGAIESLLSAMVADGMIESRHDSNQELIGQGLANLFCPWFGGISATGAIARTATNVRSGGRTPVAGIIHSLTLFIIVLVAAPLARFIPLAALSGVLLVVAWRMGEWHTFVAMSRGPRADFLVLLVTFGLTVTFDLTIAVGLGLVMAGALFVRQLEEITRIRLVTPENEFEVGADSVRDKELPEGVVVFRIEGPFFFGVAEKLEDALDMLAAQPRVIIFRMRKVPVVDGTGLRALNLMLDKFAHRHTRVILSGVQPQPMKVLFESGFTDRLGLENICANVDAALVRARGLLAQQPA